MVSAFRLLALTFFGDPTFNDKVKAGKVTSLPLIPSIPGFLGQPVLPQQYQAMGMKDPGSWPTLPGVDLPPSPFSWVGNDHHYPVTPAKDPFYTPDLSTYANLKNGDIIAIRPVGLSAVFPEVKTAWQISYRTEGATGSPAADVTTLMIPKNYDGKTLISWEVWEDACNLKCSPSYTFTTGSRDVAIDMALLQGWALNLPDHEGIKSAFGVGAKAGKSTLDSIRAVKNAQSQINFQYTNLGMYGYSGGSVAAGNALEMQPTYAPDINIKAASIGGVVGNLTSTLLTINKSLFAGFAFAGLYGLVQEFGIYDVLQTLLRPSDATRANKVLDQCSTWDVMNYVGQDLFSYMANGQATLQNPTIAGILNNEHLGKVAPQVPLFIHQGASDEIAPVGTVDSLVDFYCQSGVHVDYQRDDGLGHLLDMVAGLPSYINFFKKALNDGYVPKTCSNYQDAINNNGVSIPNTSNQNMVKAAILGDYTGFGLPNLSSY